MPWKPAPVVFTDEEGEEIDFYQEALLEPTLPATEDPGASLELHFTPTGAANERYLVGQASGPTGRARAEVSTDGGSSWDTEQAAGAAGVDETILVRGVGLAFASDDSDEVAFQAGVASSGEADWLG